MDKETKQIVMDSIKTETFPVVRGDRLGLEAVCIEPIKSKIISFFNIEFSSAEEERAFDIRFNEAVTGSGDELFKMNAVYSSSLFAFLFFSKISGDNPLTIGGIEYVDAFFEFKNKVYKGPSNMDVVLKGRSNELLFVECKFSEYLTPGPTDIRSAYFQDEQHTLARRLRSDSDSRLRLEWDGKKYQAKFDGKPVYTEGIKQIIAHLIGIENYRNGNFYEYVEESNQKDRRNDLLVKGAFQTRFIEIMFQFDKDNSKRKTYCDAASYLLSIVQDDSLLSPITYQTVLNDEANEAYKNSLPPRFIALYGLE